MTQRGRWQRVLLAALDESDAAGVAVAVRAYLGRVPTRSEVTAARRAALGLAAAGDLEARHVRVPPGEGRAGELLVIARVGGHVDDDALRRAATDQPAPEPGLLAERGDSEHYAAEAVLLAHRAAKQARSVNVDDLDLRQAGGLATQLGPALEELLSLKRRLRRRSG